MHFGGFCVLSTILLVSQQISTGSAVVCYQCIGIVGPDDTCERNVKKVLTANCTQFSACIKYSWEGGNSKTIYRDCAAPNKCEVLRATQTNTSLLTYCGTCNSTLCNSALATVASRMFYPFWVLLYIISRMFDMQIELY